MYSLASCMCRCDVERGCVYVCTVCGCWDLYFDVSLFGPNVKCSIVKHNTACDSFEVISRVLYFCAVAFV